MIPIAFQWDDAKAERNLVKHGMSFEEAKEVFADPKLAAVNATREEDGEARLKAIGRIGGRLYAVVYTQRGSATRLIPPGGPIRRKRGAMAIVRSTFDPAKAKGLSPETEARMAAMTQEEIEANALSDPDNPPWTDEELARGLFGRRVRLLREKLGLSQKEFAGRFDINLRRLQDWEQGRFQPDSVALAYLRVIEQAPDMVRRILEAV